MSEVTVHHGDSRKELRKLKAASVDAVITDTPYALESIRLRFGGAAAKPAKRGKTGAMARLSKGFMGHGWDTGREAFDPSYWEEVLRVAKPGAFVLAFGGTRTYHRLACAIEDAGFVVVDMIFWAYGSGFPKSHRVSLYIERSLCRMETSEDGRKRWFYIDDGAPMAVAPPFRHPDAALWWGWGTARKPAAEPICVAQKPLEGSIADNLLKHGVGAVNIEDCRVPIDGQVDMAQLRTMSRGPRARDDGWGMAATDAAPVVRPEGRWPSNVIHDGSDEVVAAFPLAPGQLAPVGPQHGAKTSVNVYGDFGERRAHLPRADVGTAARFFYSAKAKDEDRLGSDHPTIKPVDLMRYLVRHVTPSGGLVLDPFAGTGSTGVACLAEGMSAILIEAEEAYVADIHRRLAWARGDGRLTALETARLDDPAAQRKAAGFDMPLFAREPAE